MPSTLFFLIAATGPALFWLVYFYRKDRFAPEPKRLVMKMYGLGMLSVIPILIAYQPFNFVQGMAVPVILAPIIEETGKCLIVLFFIYRHAEFDEPIDGIIYATAVALGFATIENILYVFNSPTISDRTTVAIARAILSVPGHALFSSIFGYAIGLAKFSTPSLRPLLIFRGLLWAILAHSIFNLAASLNLMGAIGFLVLMPFLWKKFHARVEKALCPIPHSSLNHLQ